LPFAPVVLPESALLVELFDPPTPTDLPPVALASDVGANAAVAAPEEASWSTSLVTTVTELPPPPPLLFGFRLRSPPELLLPEPL
jgi:hypothetical protein